MTLRIENQLSHISHTFDNLTDTMTSKLFYNFEITLPEGLLDGIYQYTLLDDETVVATGLLQIGDFTPDNKSYSSQTRQNGYIQYNG